MIPLNIKNLTISNNAYRNVIQTSKHMQLVLMSLKPLEEIPLEVHNNLDQFFHVIDGKLEIIINGKSNILEKDHVIIVEAGQKHMVRNPSNKMDLKIYTIYAPSQHPDKLIQQTKPSESHEHYDIKYLSKLF
jgi:mannose-6-phosphate isomerase-like protein (cupin superfamily)